MAQLMSIKKNVDVQPGVGVPAIFHCSQGDKGTRIILGLLNNNDTYTIPDGTTAIIRGSRADGTLFAEITADIDTTTEIKFNLTEDMTSVAGPVECEAVMTSGTANVVGTANFIIYIEKSPASIGSVFPGTDAATTWLIDKLENEPLNSLNGESVVDAINGGSGSGLTEDVKTALLACFEKVAWIDENGQDYYDALYDALYPSASSISAVYTQQGTVYTTDTLNSLKDDLVVTAHYSDSTTRTLAPSDYALTGTLTAGTSTVYVHYGDLVTSFTVTVTARTLSSISAVYTQSGDVYAFTPLDDLKTDLVITATYNDSSSEIVSSEDYILSGTLAIGSSTVTVTYESKTTTFSVTIVACTYSISDLAKLTGAFATNQDATCKMSLNRKTSPNAYRRSFAVLDGLTSIALSSISSDSIEQQTSDYYPIRIPRGSTKLTVSITPNTQYVSGMLRNLIDGVYDPSGMPIIDGTTGYQVGSTWKEYDAVTGDSYLFITSKYNSAGTSYPTEPTGLDVVFE